jgi:hypothetical protein
MGVLALVVCPSVGQAGDGLVALQTADASCADDSGDIYVDCGNGTVTDNRTGLVWLATADCPNVAVDWSTAMEFVAGLKDISAGSAAHEWDCGLSDGSSAGEWRLPSVDELEAMRRDALGGIGGDPDCTLSPPTITNDSGGGCWVSGPSSFTLVRPEPYWSSTTYPSDTGYAFVVDMGVDPLGYASKAGSYYVWPVRGGQ